MILVVSNTKGGVGKTTLSVNIAIARSLLGKDVLLVDGDEQRSAITFTELRTHILGNCSYTAISLLGKSLRSEVRKLDNKYDDIIIDVGGRDTGSMRAALTVADTVLIPVPPRSLDIWALSNTMELVREAREVNDLRAFAVLNCADAQGSDNEEAAVIIADIDGIELLDISIGKRKAFSNAVAQGRSVLEMKYKDEKAVSEINSLIQSLYN